MKGGFRQSMAWLHSWAGLLVGWVLFFVFVTGTLGYVNTEIDHWMRPEEPLLSKPRPAADILPLATRYLRDKAPDAQSWFIDLPGSRGNRELTAAWRERPRGDEKFGKFTPDRLDQWTGLRAEPEPRATGGGFVLYRMHYQLHYMPYDWAVRIVGICAMFMLVAIVSGVITHKKIFVDLFTFRPAKGQRSWLDGHNLLSVAGLPFHLMITYTGLVIFMFTYMPVGADMVYGADQRDRFYEEAYGPDPDENALPGDPAPLAPLGPAVAQAEQVWGKGQVERVTIHNPLRANARIVVRRVTGATLTWGGNDMRFNGLTGKPAAVPPPERAAVVTNDVLRSLHEGLFAGPVIRFLYLLAGASGAAMIGTGLTLWSAKRRAKLEKGGAPHVGIAVVERLNLGTIIGLPIAIAAYFWANRLIPVGLENRADWEVHAMFITWAAMFVYPMWRPLSRAWVEMSGFAAAAFGLIPLCNALTTDRHLGVSIPAGDGILAGFDLSMLGMGLFFAWLARRCALRSRPAVAASRRQARASALQPAE